MTRKRQEEDFSEQFNKWLQRTIRHRKAVNLYKPVMGQVKVPLIKKQIKAPTLIKTKVDTLNLRVGYDFKQKKWRYKKVYIDNEIPAIIQDVIENSGIKTKVNDEKPVMLDKHRTETGWSLIFRLPPGISFSKFYALKEDFQDAIGGWVDMRFENKRAIIDVILKDFPREIPYEWDYTSWPDMELPFPVGLNLRRELIVRDLTKLPHLFIAGSPGFGKTRQIIAMIYSLMPLAAICVIDYKQIDFGWVEDRILYAENTRKALELVTQIRKEAKRRTKLLKPVKATNWKEYRQATGDTKPYIVLIIDEFAEVDNKNIWEEISRIVRVYRACGICVVGATQYPDLKTIPPNIRRMMVAKLCFPMENESASRTIIDAPDAAYISDQGRAIWKFGLEKIQVQTMLLSRNQEPYLLAEMDQPRRWESEFKGKRLPAR